MQFPEDLSSVEAFDPNEIIELLDGEEVPQQEMVTQEQSALPLEETNIAEDLDEEELQEISSKVIENYDNDLESRSER
jgi:hypothetical protein